jgi:ABC-type Fe3+ transport system permease subunit
LSEKEIMNRKLDNWALILTIVLCCVIVFFVSILVVNLFSKSVKYKSFYWWGWCPSGTTTHFDQSQNAFTINDFIKANRRCCADGYYGVVTKRGKNICCANRFNCLDD